MLMCSLGAWAQDVIVKKDGTKRLFESTATPVVEVNQPKTDDELLKMYNYMDSTNKVGRKVGRKIKRLKRTGWIVGSMVAAVGTIFIGAGIYYTLMYDDGTDWLAMPFVSLFRRFRPSDVVVYTL